MLAAAWHPSGIVAARAEISRIADAIVRSPKATFEGPNVVIAAWNDAELDAEAACATLGTIDRTPGRLTLGSATRLRGVYGLMAECEESLLLARGALGGRSLFFRAAGAGFVASSRIPPLLAGLQDRPALDFRRLAALCANIDAPDETSTPFLGITRVRGCEAVVLGRSGVTRASRVTPSLLELRGHSIDDLAAELWARTQAAVTRSIGNRQRVAVLASGGLDSSGVLAASLARSRGANPKEVFALAVDFGGPGDDRPYLRDLATALGIVPLRLSPRDAGQWLTSSFVIDSVPYVVATAPLEQLLYRRAKELGAEGVLTGSGGDEILGGDLRVLSHEARRSPLAVLVRAARLEVPWRSTPLTRVTNLLLRPLLSPLKPKWFSRLRTRATPKHYPWAGPLLREVLGVARADRPNPVARSPEQRYNLFACGNLWCDLVDGRGQIESATGCTRLDPLLDDELLAFLSCVPAMHLTHGNRHRGLFRLALRSVIPDNLRLRSDKAFFEPAIAQFVDSGGGLDVFRDLFNVRALEGMGLVERPAFEADIERLKGSKLTAAEGPLWNTIWRILSVEAFARRVEAGAIG